MGKSQTSHGHGQESCALVFRLAAGRFINCDLRSVRVMMHLESGSDRERSEKNSACVREEMASSGLALVSYGGD
jgi:hypothetical protein